MKGELVRVDLYQLARPLLLLAALLAPLPVLAQYSPYRMNTFQQPRPYSPPAPVKPFHERFPQQERNGAVIIHQNNQPKVCSRYAGVTNCP